MDLGAMLKKIKENPKDITDMLRMLQSSVAKGNGDLEGLLGMYRSNMSGSDFEEVIYHIWATRQLEERREASKKTL